MNRFIDLFAGIGGFRIGFENAGFQCVFSCEINKKCQEVYFSNFNEMPYSDIREVIPEKIPDFEVLLAGFPCQPFSISGRQLGFEDTRGTLFFDICRIINQKLPKIVILENVKHLFYHDKGRTLKVITNTLRDFGYKVNYEVLNAKDFGVPQNRERIFIICFKTHFFDFTKSKRSPTPKLKDFLDKDGDFQILDKNEYTLINNPRKQKSGLIFVGYRNKKIRTVGVRPNTEHLSRVHKMPNRIYSADGVHPTLSSQEPSGRYFIYIKEKDLVRKLTIGECYRIMGFPENFKRDKSLPESYKQVGNSVCVPLVEEIANSIKRQRVLKNDSQRKAVRDFQAILFD